ncbi:MAG: hypothetical protein LAT65_01935 [Saccharospirillum sp.]|nr:hypothetical protein [Saccharospirillum sp.]
MNSFVGYSEVTFFDCVYFSVAKLTTVGWGDLAATGDIRFLAGCWKAHQYKGLSVGFRS